MHTLLSFVQTLILLGLSLIHFSWVLGSKWGFEKALPTNAEGIKVLNPSRLDSTIVATGLLLFATYYMLKGNFISLPVPSFVLAYAGWAISAIFILRAIGDFKYIGFFKSVTGTEFASLDTMFYSPLCLGLGIIAILLEVI
ncbi:MAG: DUF3995 domain-containing protein [Cyclobacteriaceae bacterium]|nr:DUF3995 domain-containing protein [Cyclobacteriaceae bacterium]